MKKANNSGTNRNLDDTIAAIATPFGSGGIGIIRISGPHSLDILCKIFKPQSSKSTYKPYMLRFGRIISHIDSQVLDEVLAVYMPKPRSFTGEEMVEIYCHAGLFTLNAILNNIIQFDCRLAEPGEFSMRRFLNHGVDISKLEGAAEIITAKTNLAYRLSREHLLGAYGKHISDLRNQIVNLLAELEADIDFPEEESVGTIGKSMIEKRLVDIIESLEQLSESYRSGKIIQDGYRVILMGPPNSGKSSLFNRLVKRNRALVTPIAGTTRDYISEWIDIKGLPVELFDTAGLRKGRGTIEKAGIEGTRKLIGQADLIVYLIDLTAKNMILPDAQTYRDRALLIAFNKADLLPKGSSRAEKWQLELGNRYPSCPLSAKTGKGIIHLSNMIYEKAGVADLTSSLVVTSLRHKSKIDSCLKHLRHVREISNQPAEIVSFELRRAADNIGEITGDIYDEDILHQIFSNFCIGK